MDDLPILIDIAPYVAIVVAVAQVFVFVMVFRERRRRRRQHHDVTVTLNVDGHKKVYRRLSEDTYRTVVHALEGGGAAGPEFPEDRAG